MPARVLLLCRSRVRLDARACADLAAVSRSGMPQRSRVSGAAVGQSGDRLRETRQLLYTHRRFETGAENPRSPGEAQVAQIPEGTGATRQSALVAKRFVAARLLLDLAARRARHRRDVPGCRKPQGDLSAFAAARTDAVYLSRPVALSGSA